MTGFRIFVYLLLTGFGAQASDFGVADWGASREKILADETRINLTPIGQFEYLVYETSFGVIEDIKMVYHFGSQGLNKGVFLFNAQANNTLAAINQYREIVSAISKVYGSAAFDGPITVNSEMEVSEQQWADLLAEDQLMFQSEWLTGTSKIQHQLTMHQGVLHHQLVYQPLMETSGQAESLF